MLNRLSTLFGSFREAVVMTKDGDVRYFNAAAAGLIPLIETKKPEDILPIICFEQESDTFSGETEINGTHVIVTASKLDDVCIYILTTADCETSQNTANILSALSTELKNSLSSLKMASGLLLPYIENLGNPQMNRYASIIYHCYYNMLRVATNVGELGGIIRDDVPLNRSAFDMISACRDLIDSVRHFIEDKNIDIQFVTKEDILLVFADRVKLDKMILNLLSNSLLFTPANGTLTLTVVSAGDRFVITVSDSGGGISSDIMKTAWNRYGEKKDTNSANMGIGVGLTIVQNIARLHGGSAMLESKPGEGTTVTVSIPVIMPGISDDRAGVSAYENNDMQQILTELSGVIGFEKYTQRYMD